jgi:large subunit ribosomal protein L28
VIELVRCGVIQHTKTFKLFIPMSRICAITGKRPKVGGRIIHKGVSKKAGGIGLQLVKNNKRTFRPNVQRIRVKLPSGQVKRMWVSVKAIKAGKVLKG